MKKRYLSGFALLEILATTALLVGLAALLMAFSHNKKQQAIDVKTGQVLAIIVNDIIKETPSGGSCHFLSATVPLDECISISDNLKKALNDVGIDTKNIKTHRTDWSSGQVLLYLSIDGTFSHKKAAIYAQQILNRLTPQSLSHFSSIDPAEQNYPPISYQLYKDYYKDVYTSPPYDKLEYRFYFFME